MSKSLKAMAAADGKQIEMWAPTKQQALDMLAKWLFDQPGTYTTSGEAIIRDGKPLSDYTLVCRRAHWCIEIPAAKRG